MRCSGLVTETSFCNRDQHGKTTNQSAASWIRVLQDIQLQNNPTAKAQGTGQKGEPDIVREAETWWEVVSPTKNRSYIGKILPTWPPKPEVNNNDTNDQVKLNWEKPTRSELYTKNFSQPGKAENRKGGLLQRRTHQLFVQCQMVSPENKYPSTIIRMNRPYLGDIWVYMYMYIFNNN